MSASELQSIPHVLLAAWGLLKYPAFEPNGDTSQLCASHDNDADCNPLTGQSRKPVIKEQRSSGRSSSNRKASASSSHFNWPSWTAPSGEQGVGESLSPTSTVQGLPPWCSVSSRVTMQADGEPAKASTSSQSSNRLFTMPVPKCDACKLKIKGQYVHCVECIEEPVNICVQCYCKGAQFGSHMRDHAYTIVNYAYNESAVESAVSGLSKEPYLKEISSVPKVEDVSLKLSCRQVLALLFAVEKFGLHWSRVAETVSDPLNGSACPLTAQNAEYAYQSIVSRLGGVKLFSDVTKKFIPAALKGSAAVHGAKTAGHIGGPANFMPARSEFESEYLGAVDQVMSSIMSPESVESQDALTAALAGYNLLLDERDRRHTVVPSSGLVQLVDCVQFSKKRRQEEIDMFEKLRTVLLYVRHAGKALRVSNPTLPIGVVLDDSGKPNSNTSGPSGSGSGSGASASTAAAAVASAASGTSSKSPSDSSTCLETLQAMAVSFSSEKRLLERLRKLSAAVENGLFCDYDLLYQRFEADKRRRTDAFNKKTGNLWGFEPFLASAASTEMRLSEQELALCTELEVFPVHFYSLKVLAAAWKLESGSAKSKSSPEPTGASRDLIQFLVDNMREGILGSWDGAGSLPATVSGPSPVSVPGSSTNLVPSTAGSLIASSTSKVVTPAPILDDDGKAKKRKRPIMTPELILEAKRRLATAASQCLGDSEFMSLCSARLK